MVQPRTPDRYTAGRLAVWRGGDGPNFSLKRRPRFHLAPRVGQNGASPGFRAIQHGQCALGALEGRFWLPGRCVRIGGRAPAQGVRPSAMEALGVRNGQFPLRWSLLTTPFRNPMGRDRPVRAPRALGESGWTYRVARASRICTNPRGRRFRHFGGRHRTSYRSIRSPVAPCRPGRHGGRRGILI
jgi:hypothetical protein